MQAGFGGAGQAADCTQAVPPMPIAQPVPGGPGHAAGIVQSGLQVPPLASASREKSQTEIVITMKAATMIEFNSEET